MHHEERAVEPGNGITSGILLRQHSPKLVGQGLPGVEFRDEPAHAPVTAMAIPQDLLYVTHGRFGKAARIGVRLPWSTGCTY